MKPPLPHTLTGSAITLTNVTRRYGAQTVLDGVSLSLPAGRITALLGPSGSGKSTLLRLIAGLEPLDGGEIFLGETPVARPGFSVPPEQRRVGVVFQDYALFPHLDALDNVAFGLSDGSRAERRASALPWLERVGLGHKAQAFPQALSGGEQQRVALARAMAPQPRAVLLDEPFSGLDPSLRADLRDTAMAALATASATALFVTHDADEALYVADRLAILQEGRLIQADEPSTVYRQPASVAAAAALGPVNVVQAVANGATAITPFGPAPLRTPHQGKIILAVRAQGLLLSPGAQAVVLDRRPQGALDAMRLEANGVVWRALAPASAAIRPGDRVAVSFDAEQVHAFPA
jgi:iron(III) transport system ATP-binding protein